MTDFAPLRSVPEAPAPEAGQAEWVAGQGGLRLRAALFPVADARGSVVVSPGRTEPIEKYFEVVEELQARGFVVLVHDWRGHGLSQRLHADALRGQGAPARSYLEDYRLVLAAFADRLPRPWLMLGHSMGGALNLTSLVEGEDRFAGAVLTSPMLGLAMGGLPPLVGRLLAGLATRLGLSGAYVGGAGDPLGGTFEANVLTHDLERWTRTQRLLEAWPDLRLGFVTWGWLDFALSLDGRLARLDPGGLHRPLTILSAGEEKLVDNAAIEAFAARMPRCRHVEVARSYHEILMETDDRRAVFWAEFDSLAAKAA